MSGSVSACRNQTLQHAINMSRRLTWCVQPYCRHKLICSIDIARRHIFGAAFHSAAALVPRMGQMACPQMAAVAEAPVCEAQRSQGFHTCELTSTSPSSPVKYRMLSWAWPTQPPQTQEPLKEGLVESRLASRLECGMYLGLLRI